MHLKGKYNDAKVFVDELEPGAKTQILELLDQKISQDSKIRIMPDVHVGMGCVIGTTMQITDKLVPNLVGVDIGCGLIVIELKDRVIDFKKLDDVIRKYIPSGFAIRNRRHKNAQNIDLSQLRCKDHVDIERGYLSIGTLGGGNHFIEMNEDKDYQKYLVIHSGSRNIGLQTAQYYQKKAQEYVKEKGIDIPKDLAYLEGKLKDDYLHDMAIIQKFARLNRETMADIIVSQMNFKVIDSFQTIHNYIDIEHNILRKGAVSAQKGERFIIPFNMADGSVILKGKGNPDWNYSAPHGAGRVMSRRQAKRNLKVDAYKKRVSNVYTTSVSHHTLDEAPQVYKDPKDILKNITETATLEKTLKAIYNFKAK